MIYAHSICNTVFVIDPVINKKSCLFFFLQTDFVGFLKALTNARVH